MNAVRVILQMIIFVFIIGVTHAENEINEYYSSPIELVDEEGHADSFENRSPAQAIENESLSQGCCRICTKGKACGNSCISRRYTCHQPPGCACDG